ncbi:site-specific integrase [Methylobacterium sp. E-025]|uniref:site-specific integrase n=1 Tax=Methylobacterium sp. E-025 TaxID=2836561 RepID=UPI001FB9B04A|nr:site-specific integrase [Methylobacterium sp. E-025]MCJ2113462.1 site-specific integrase [Methylobacterium sp. E-025]
MGSVTNVVQRGRTFHFRRRVPADLRRRLGRHELVRSLGTGEVRAAKLGACQLYVAAEQLFSTLRAAPMLTDDQIAHLVRDFYDTILVDENAGRLRRGSLPKGVREARVTQYATMAAKGREALAANRLDEAAFVAEMMLKRQGIAIRDLAPADAAKAKQAMLRAGIDLSEALKARYEGDFNYEPRDKLLKATLAEPPAKVWPTPASAPMAATATAPPAASPPPEKDELAPAPNIPFEERGKAFRDQQVQTKRWDKQTAAQAGATYRLFVDVCGDKPLEAYTRKDAGRFRERVERLPSDYGKHPRYRGLSVEAILSAYTALPEGTRTGIISQKTVKRHFSALSTLWTAAVAEGDASENIFSGHRFAATRKPSEQRDMWEQADLARLFATPVWTGCRSATQRSTPGTLVLRDERFWLPLIAVFSGLRQEEICQLQIEDVRQENEIWYFDINDRPPRKLKNGTAIRRVPVHSDLIKLGFLEHVERLRRSRQTRVFPAFRPGGADDRLGHAFTKWFTRYRRDVSLYRPGLNFHSFRHTATTLMHQSGVATAVIDHVTGHTTPGETARYTKRSTLAQLKAAIETIQIDVDLSPLSTCVLD